MPSSSIVRAVPSSTTSRAPPRNHPASGRRRPLHRGQSPDTEHPILAESSDATGSALGRETRHGQHERRVALGRKTFLSVGGKRGGENLAILYSLVTSCEQNGRNPLAYLTDVLLGVADHPASKFDELLPDRWRPPDRAGGTPTCGSLRGEERCPQPKWAAVSAARTREEHGERSGGRPRRATRTMRPLRTNRQAGNSCPISYGY